MFYLVQLACHYLSSKVDFRKRTFYKFEVFFLGGVQTLACETILNFWLFQRFQQFDTEGLRLFIVP